MCYAIGGSFWPKRDKWTCADLVIKRQIFHLGKRLTKCMYEYKALCLILDTYFSYRNYQNIQNRKTIRKRETCLIEGKSWSNSQAKKAFDYGCLKIDPSIDLKDKEKHVGNFERTFEVSGCIGLAIAHSLRLIRLDLWSFGLNVLDHRSWSSGLIKLWANWLVRWLDGLI